LTKDLKEGYCHVCGTHGRLSFDHVPPRSAFNDRPVVVAKALEVIGPGSDLDRVQGRVQQRGAGGYTLCERCNSLTGKWYGRAFAEWTYQGMCVLASARGERSAWCSFRIHPLRVLKQIICMFFSTDDRMRGANPELVPFVLNREATHMAPSTRVFAYFNPTGRHRQTGIAAALHVDKGTFDVWNEVSSFPIGYLLAIDSEPPPGGLVDISFFADYRYEDTREFWLKMPIFSIYTPFPGDYRPRDEVLKSAQKAKESRMQRDTRSHQNTD